MGYRAMTGPLTVLNCTGTPTVASKEETDTFAVRSRSPGSPASEVSFLRTERSGSCSLKALVSLEAYFSRASSIKAASRTSSPALTNSS